MAFVRLGRPPWWEGMGVKAVRHFYLRKAPMIDLSFVPNDTCRFIIVVDQALQRQL